ncbi:helix-turn-helix domain-containing protein [Nocardiopsis sp. EMB25]|nr:helix-turn-helix domain-containing protein [Nocardiopsis sp. EMB25]
MRTQVGLTLAQAAESADMSPSKLSRLEAGKAGRPRKADIAVLCEVYSAPEQLRAALEGMARASKDSWWSSYEDAIPDTFGAYLGLEATAARICWHDPNIIPGLAQTDAYARTMITTADPDAEPGEIDRRLQLRMGRQGILNRIVGAPDLRVVVGEAALRRPVGGPGVMAAQLEHLIKLGRSNRVTLRVMPLAAPIYQALPGGAFILLDFPALPGRDDEPATVYVEGLAGELYLDRPQETGHYRAAWDDLWRRALDPTRSEQMISHIAKGMRR